MASARLVAFAAELDRAVPGQQARAEALILRVPGEGQPALAQAEEAAALTALGDALVPAVQRWLAAVEQLGAVERGWGPAERAAEAGAAFNQATEDFLAVWERLLRVQPATPPMAHVLGLIHQGCYELFLSGPADLAQTCRAIVEGRAEAKLTFEPRAPSLAEATATLRELRGAARGQPRRGGRAA